jgi:hypothetical protein
VGDPFAEADHHRAFAIAWPLMSGWQRPSLGRKRGGRVAKAVLVVGVLIAAASQGHARGGGPAPPKWAPPVRYLPLDQVEPARTTKASAWPSPFCTKWNDGCEGCERPNAKAPARCSAPSGSDTTACRRHSMICSSVDWDALTEVCAIWKLYELNVATQHLLLAGQSVSHHDNGALNEWARKTRTTPFLGIPREEFLRRKGYLLMPSAILGVQRWITLESLQFKWPGLEVGRSHISDYYCQATYQELPPQPAD